MSIFNKTTLFKIVSFLICIICGFFVAKITIYNKKVPIVYFTKDLSSNGIKKLYAKVNSGIEGKVAIKVHTGERNGPNILPREWVKDFMSSVPNSTIVETNTWYKGDRYTTEDHRKTLEVNGWTEFTNVDIMDENGEVPLPIKGGKHFKAIHMGKNILNYNSMIVLTHFKGHAMGGFGGSIKNIAIGCAGGRIGKAEVHSISNGELEEELKVDDKKLVWKSAFMENMVESAMATTQHFGKHITYINVLRNMSVDCDCAGTTAEKPKLSDIGILASKDIVAIDQASIDMVWNAIETENSSNKDLKERITSREGLHQLEYGEEMKLGSRKYKLVEVK